MRLLPALALCVAVAAAPSSRTPDMPYGRFHITGAPVSYEFFRATFGGLIPCAARPLRFAGQDRLPSVFLPNISSFNTSTFTGCEPYGAGDDMAGKFVVAWRGGCSFVQKALVAQAAGAAGLIVINTEGGLVRMPMGNITEGASVTIPAVMVKNVTGSVLLASLALSRASGVPQLPSTSVGAGFLVPSKVVCVPDAAQWTPTAVAISADGSVATGEEGEEAGGAPSASVPMITTSPTDVESGTLVFRGALPPAAPTGPVEFSVAAFGGPVFPSLTANLTLTPTFGSYGCERYPNGSIPVGSVVVVARGNCTMIDKARFAQDAGAGGLLIVGNAPDAPDPAVAAAFPSLNLAHMYGRQLGCVQAVNDDLAPLVVIPAFMLSHRTSSWLLTALPSSSIGVSSFSLSDVPGSGEAWATLVEVRDAGAAFWPQGIVERNDVLLALRAKHSPLFPAVRPSPPSPCGHVSPGCPGCEK